MKIYHFRIDFIIINCFFLYPFRYKCTEFSSILPKLLQNLDEHHVQNLIKLPIPGNEPSSSAADRNLEVGSLIEFVHPKLLRCIHEAKVTAVCKTSKCLQITYKDCQGRKTSSCQKSKKHLNPKEKGSKPRQLEDPEMISFKDKIGTNDLETCTASIHDPCLLHRGFCYANGLELHSFELTTAEVHPHTKMETEDISESSCGENITLDVNKEKSFMKINEETENNVGCLNESTISARDFYGRLTDNKITRKCSPDGDENSSNKPSDPQFQIDQFNNKKSCIENISAEKESICMKIEHQDDSEFKPLLADSSSHKHFERINISNESALIAIEPNCKINSENMELISRGYYSESIEMTDLNPQENSTGDTTKSEDSKASINKSCIGDMNYVIKVDGLKESIPTLLSGQEIKIGNSKDFIDKFRFDDEIKLNESKKCINNLVIHNETKSNVSKEFSDKACACEETISDGVKQSENNVCIIQSESKDEQMEPSGFLNNISAVELKHEIVEEMEPSGAVKLKHEIGEEMEPSEDEIDEEMSSSEGLCSGDVLEVVDPVRKDVLCVGKVSRVVDRLLWVELLPGD